MIKDWLIKTLGGRTECENTSETIKTEECWREKMIECNREAARLRQEYICTLFQAAREANMRKFSLVKDAPADTKLPTRGSKNAAGYDFYAPHEFIVPAHGMSSMIHFNIKACMPSDEYLQLKIRSGLSMKHDIMLIGSGVIDADFYENPDNDGNIAARFINHGDVDYVVQKGERCMQGIFLKYGTVADDAANGVRGGGYGSTGKF